MPLLYMLGADSANQAELGLQRQTGGQTGGHAGGHVGGHAGGHSTSHGRADGHTSRHASQQLNGVSPFLRCCSSSPSLVHLLRVLVQHQCIMHGSLNGCNAVLARPLCFWHAAIVCVPPSRV